MLGIKEELSLSTWQKFKRLWNSMKNFIPKIRQQSQNGKVSKKTWIIKTDKEEIESLKKHIPSKEIDIPTEYFLTKKSPDSDGFTGELY